MVFWRKKKTYTVISLYTCTLALETIRSDFIISIFHDLCARTYTNLRYTHLYNAKQHLRSQWYCNLCIFIPIQAYMYHVIKRIQFIRFIIKAYFIWSKIHNFAVFLIYPEHFYSFANLYHLMNRIYIKCNVNVWFFFHCFKNIRRLYEHMMHQTRLL